MREPTELPQGRRVPHPTRLAVRHPAYAANLECHEAAIARNDDCYVDPVTGYQVFTARLLWERGFCCDQGCRHCPWLER